MFSTALVIFREILEIAMILGVILVATRGLPGRLKWIVGGLVGGLAGAGLVAVFAQSISESLSGMGQEFFNAGILFTAALMIGWTVLWMRRHAREMVMHLRQVGHDVTTGKLPHTSLAMIIGLAMLREGSEIVMFIYGMALSGQDTTSIIGGSIIGVTLGTIVGTMLYYGLLKIPARHMLAVTSWLLMLLVAGLVSQGVGYLSAAGYFTDYSKPLWNTSWLLSEDSIFGKSLHSLIGYTARPSAVQLVTYLGTLIGLFSATTWIDREKKHSITAIATALVLVLVTLPFPAHAIDHFYSPIVVKGELEMEYIGNRTFDNSSAKNNVQGHEVELEYGVTDRIKTIVSGAFEKNPGESLKMNASQLESVFQFTPQGEYWLDTGLLATYGIATQSHQPNFIETKLLLQKDMGKFTHLANIGLQQNVGQYSGGTGGPDYSVMWSSRYRANEYVQPGLEIHSDLGRGHTLGRFNEQENYLGPAMYGIIIPHLKYQVAYTFGISDAAAKSAARMLLEYEMFF